MVLHLMVCVFAVVMEAIYYIPQYSDSQPWVLVVQLLGAHGKFIIK